jgi:hypothetical protein
MTEFYVDNDESDANTNYEGLPDELIQEIEFFESEMEDIAESCQ